MDPIARMVAAGAAGAAGGGDPTYVDDVFSTFLYVGNNGTNVINNGIDLSGEGGLVWIKDRENVGDHFLYDTERGAAKFIRSNAANTENSTGIYGLQSFNSDGFTLGGNWSGENGNGYDIASWTFRKAPGFFDIVTYTGNSTAGHTISHNLGSTPGMIIIKNRSNAEQWQVWHRSVTGNLELDNTGAANTSSVRVDSVTSTSFNLTGAFNTSNANGQTYVAYIFAHDDQSFGTSGNDTIIKCGSYTGTGLSSNQEIDLGFEPQWMIIKNTSNTSNWIIVDIMRGWRGNSTPGDALSLTANTNGSEPTNGGRVYVTSRGFAFGGETNASYNASGDNYIYMAIRRPHKPPTDATEVFAIDTGSSSSTVPTWDSGFPVDMSFIIYPNFGGMDNFSSSRLVGSRYLTPNQNYAEASDGSQVWDSNVGHGKGYNYNYYSYMFRRAPGFFDVVTYIGTGSPQAINHNLQAIPELIIVKNRDYNFRWATYAQAFGRTKYLYLDGSDSIYTASEGTFWGTSDFTSTQFFLGNYGNTNSNTHDHIAYLFASLSGISKVGSFTGTGSNVNVDCGFTAGARFILIKRTDSTGDWYVWDTTRGIASGNDPYSLLNSYAVQVTNTDYVDPLNAGFTVTSNAPAELNANGGTYLFLAFA